MKKQLLNILSVSLISFSLVACFHKDSGGSSGGSSSGGDNTQNNTSQETDEESQTTTVIAARSEFAEVLSEPLGEPVRCAMSLSVPAGVPGEVVQIANIPEDFGESSIRVLGTVGKDLYIAPLFLNAYVPGENPTFVVPPHPSGDSEGGIVELELGDGEKHCPVVPFEILALPAAPSDYVLSVTSLLEDYVDAMLIALGYDPEALLSTAKEELAPEKVAAWLLKQIVSGEREDALPQLAKVISQDGDDYIERFLMATGVYQLLEAELSRVLSKSPSSGTTAASTYNPNAASFDNPENTKILSSRRAGFTDMSKLLGVFLNDNRTYAKSTVGGCFGVEAQGLEIHSAQALSDHMKNAKSSASDEDAGKAGNKAIGLAGLIPNKVGKKAGILGDILYSIQLVRQIEEAQVPRKITSFNVNRAETLWVEDRPSDRLAFWDGATVQAQGKSFNLAKTSLEVLLKALAYAPGPLGGSAKIVNALLPESLGKLIDEITSGGCMTISAPHYGPIAVNHVLWTESEIKGEAFEKVTHQQYRGVKLGTAELTVKLKEKEFPDTGPMEEKFTLEAQQLRLSPSQREFNLNEPGKTLEIYIRATNAYNDDKAKFTAYIPGDNKGAITSQSKQGDDYKVVFQTPSDRADYPTAVKLQALYKTLPGSPSGDTREVTVTIDIKGEVTITPRSACLTPGQLFNLHAQLEGFAPDKRGLEWASSPTAVFSDKNSADTIVEAPSTIGDFEVTVTSLEDSKVKDTVTYEVASECITKIWSPVGGIYLDGEVESQSTSVDCPEEIYGTQKAAFDEPTVYPPPDLPPESALWQEEYVSRSGEFVHSSTRNRKTPDAGCSTIALTGSAGGIVEVSSNNQGAFNLKLGADFSNQCDQYSTGEAECTEGRAVNGGSGNYYLTVGAEPASYRLSGSLSCSAVEIPRTTSREISVSVMRYIDGELYIPTDPSQTKIKDQNGNSRSPELVSISGRCSGADEIIFFDEIFVLDAAESGEDHVFVVVDAGILMVSDYKPGSDLVYDPATGGMKYADNEPPLPGTYTNQGDLEINVQLQTH